MKRGRKLVHEKIKKKVKMSPAACVFLSLLAFLSQRKLFKYLFLSKAHVFQRMELESTLSSAINGTFCRAIFVKEEDLTVGQWRFASS